MSKFQYRVKCPQEIVSFAGAREQTSSILSPGGNSCEDIDEVCWESGELQRAEAVKIEVEAKRNVLDNCISSVEGTLRLASTGRIEKAEKVMRVIFDLSSHALKLRP